MRGRPNEMLRTLMFLLWERRGGCSATAALLHTLAKLARLRRLSVQLRCEQKIEGIVGKWGRSFVKDPALRSLDADGFFL